MTTKVISVPVEFMLLLETEDYLLLETGDNLILEEFVYEDQGVIMLNGVAIDPDLQYYHIYGMRLTDTAILTEDGAYLLQENGSKILHADQEVVSTDSLEVSAQATKFILQGYN